MLSSMPRFGRIGRSASLVARSMSSKPDSVAQLPPFDYDPPPYDGPSKEEVIALRKQYLNPGTSRRSARPRVWEVGGRV